MAQLDLTSDSNVEQAEKIVQKRPELLQWQADYKSCLQKEHELESEADQILALTPEVKKVASFDQDKIVQLKEDYNHWVKQEVPDKKPKSVVSQTIFYLGLPIFILGLGLLIYVPTAGWTLMAAGILMMGGAYYNLNQVVKQNKIVDQFQANVDKSQKNFEEKYGISPLGLDLNNLLGQLTQYQFKKRSEKNNQAQISEIKTRLDKVAVELKKILKEPVNADFSDELNAINKVDTELKNLQQKQQRKDEIQASLKTSSQKLMKLQLELKDVLVQNKVRTLEEFDDLYQESLVQTKLNAQIVALENSLQGDLDELTKLTPDKLKSKLSEAITAAQEINDKLDLLQASFAKVEVQKANLADSNAVFKAKQKLANTKTLFINASKEYLSNLMTAQLIQRTLDIASNERFPKMLQEAKEYLKLLTGGRYVDLVLDKKLKVVNQDGKKIEVKYLSRGTSEQLYFALKLAFIDQIKDQI
ncbi:MAG: DNA repair protein, partial [Lactobacillus sp.]|nr:DNA repair protein [Lactobacillus sp.]